MYLYIVDVAIVFHRPLLLGYTSDGERACVRIKDFRWTTYAEPLAYSHHDDVDAAVTWSKKYVSPHLAEGSSYAGVDKKHYLIGGHRPSWMTRLSHSSPMAMRKTCKALQSNECRVYNNDLDPVLMVFERTGLRCYRYVLIEAHDRAVHKWTSCPVEVLTSITQLKTQPDGILPPPKLPIVSFDFETDGLDGTTGEIRMIGMVIRNDDAYDRVLLSRVGMASRDNVDYRLEVIAREIDLIQRFCDIVSTSCAAFITGYNIFGFDLDFLVKRLEKLDGGSLRRLQPLSWVTNIPVEASRRTLSSSGKAHSVSSS